MDLRVAADPSAAAAAFLARRIRDAVRRRGAATIAVSGGGTAPPLFAALAVLDVPWDRTTVWQVDERVAPDGHPERNAGQLTALPARVMPMPVTAADLARAARRYGATLPERFDVVHLGLGDDGHTASWPPGDPVVDATDSCTVVGEFNGFRRMTLTPPVVNGARARLMLTTGASKAPMVARWLLRDPGLPVARVRRRDTWVFLDPAAAADLHPVPVQGDDGHRDDR
jgi:6-phosphogluconolactonase/glucosamine-6-phosphate isomerase/deaminase